MRRFVESGFGKVHGAREQNDADHEEENEEPELAHAGADRLSEDLQTFGVPRQFENSKNSHQSDDTKNRERHGMAATASRLFVVYQHGTKRHVIRNNSDQHVLVYCRNQL